MTEGSTAAPRFSATTVACLYMGAHTLHTCEKRDAWTTATSRSTGWTLRSALLPGSVDDVG